MSGWVRRALTRNLPLKVLSLALAVLLHVLVRPAPQQQKRQVAKAAVASPASAVARRDSGPPAEPRATRMGRQAVSAAPSSRPTSGPASSPIASPRDMGVADPR